jgi:hypothetical protein
MSAPTSPTIKVRQDGHKVYVRWLPVDTATDYQLYVKEAGGDWGVEDSISDSEINPDGWFFDITGPLAGVVNVRLTALNALAEESDYSNEVQVNLRGAGATVHPTDALQHIRKGF